MNKFTIIAAFLITVFFTNNSLAIGSDGTESQVQVCHFIGSDGTEFPIGSDGTESQIGSDGTESINPIDGTINYIGSDGTEFYSNGDNNIVCQTINTNAM